MILLSISNQCHIIIKSSQDREATMPDNSFGEISLPLHCRVSASGDRKKVALTFQCPDRTPVTVVLPIAGAAGLQRKLAQALYILTAKPPVADVPVADGPAAEPVLAAAE
jgi:hypothetical protein